MNVISEFGDEKIQTELKDESRSQSKLKNGRKSKISNNMLKYRGIINP